MNKCGRSNRHDIRISMNIEELTVLFYNKKIKGKSAKECFYKFIECNNGNYFKYLRDKFLYEIDNKLEKINMYTIIKSKCDEKTK